MNPEANPRPPTPGSRVYVLRVWREGPQEPYAWRAVVRHGTEGDRRYFASLDECIEHLYSELARR